MGDREKWHEIGLGRRERENEDKRQLDDRKEIGLGNEKASGMIKERYGAVS